MEHANREHWVGAALVMAALVLLMRGHGSRAMNAVSHAAGTVPSNVLAVQSLQLADLRLSLKFEFDTPSGCALMRGFWSMVA